MKIKILIGVLIGLIFLFGQSVCLGEDQKKLSPKQRAVSQMLGEKIWQKFYESRDEQKKRGVRFKHGLMDVWTGGHPEKNDLLMRITIFIVEPTGILWTFTILKSWPKCPEPDSPEIDQVIKRIVETIISKIKLSPSWPLV